MGIPKNVGLLLHSFKIKFLKYSQKYYAMEFEIKNVIIIQK